MVHALCPEYLVTCHLYLNIPCKDGLQSWNGPNSTQCCAEKSCWQEGFLLRSSCTLLASNRPLLFCTSLTWHPWCRVRSFVKRHGGVMSDQKPIRPEHEKDWVGPSLIPRGMFLMSFMPQMVHRLSHLYKDQGAPSSSFQIQTFHK